MVTIDNPILIQIHGNGPSNDIYHSNYVQNVGHEQGFIFSHRLLRYLSIIYRFAKQRRSRCDVPIGNIEYERVKIFSNHFVIL